MVPAPEEQRDKRQGKSPEIDSSTNELECGKEAHCKLKQRGNVAAYLWGKGLEVGG